MMGFIQDRVQGCFVNTGKEIARFKTSTNLDYESKNGRIINIRAGYLTDGYSKTLRAKIFGKKIKWNILEALVGGRFEDDLRPAILHDYLCENKGYHIPVNDTLLKFVPVSFTEVNDLFYEAMISAGMGKYKSKVMRIAVNFNLNRW